MTTSQNASPAIDETLGENLKSWRIQRDLTQEAVVAEMVKRGFDFYQSTLYKIESGKRRVIFGEAVALSEILQVSLEVLTTPSQDSEEALLARLRIGAKTQLERIEETVSQLNNVEEAFMLQVKTNLLKLETLHEAEKVHTFGNVKATARDFYKPLLEAQEALDNIRQTLKDISRRTEKLAHYLNV